MKAYMTTGGEVIEMVAALKAVGVFTIEKTSETIKAIHTKSGKLVLAGLKKGSSDAWIMRQHPQLWA